MNSAPHNSIDETQASIQTGEDTLRMIAALPAPEGLEGRIHAALRAAPRQGRLLAWPAVFRVQTEWVRAAAAAAIVFVVAGGGWGVYSHIQPLQTGNGAPGSTTPARVGTGGGFSGAGAVRTPQTLDRPVVSEPPKSAEHSAGVDATHRKAHKKPVAVGTPGQNAVQAAPAIK